MDASRCIALIVVGAACTPARSDGPRPSPADPSHEHTVAAQAQSSRASQPAAVQPAQHVQLAHGDAPGYSKKLDHERARAGKLYDVGELPAELTLNWPSPPRTTRVVEVDSLGEFARAAGRNGTRVVVTRDLAGDATVNGSDVEVAVRPGVRIDRLVIAPGQKRVAIRGGRYGLIRMTLPAQFVPTRVAKPEWMIEDVIIDDVQIDSPEIGIGIYGRRVAVLRSEINAQTYAIWSEAIMGIRSEDIVLAGNRFKSAGPEATVRLVSVVRSVTVDNVLENSMKHNYRIHGHSDLNYAAGNVLVNTGVMIGTMPEDEVGRAWFERNTFYQTAPDLFHPDESRVKALQVRDNVAYTDAHKCFVCCAVPATWHDSGNRILPYRRAPDRPRPRSQGDKQDGDRPAPTTGRPTDIAPPRSAGAMPPTDH